MLQIKNYKEANISEWLPMHGSEAQGISLVKLKNFAADMLKFSPGNKTSLHTHPGNHILFVVEGSGSLLYNNEIYSLTKGICYLVPGAIVHQITAGKEELILMSIADDHKSVTSKDRVKIIQDCI